MEQLCFMPNAMLQRYSIALTRCWTVSLYIVCFFSDSGTYFPSNGYSFVLSALSIPVIAAVLIYTPWKKLQFAGGIFCAAVLFYNTPINSFTPKTDRILDVKLPYQITEKDHVFLSDNKNTFIASFFPAGTSVKLLKETSDLKNPDGHTYLLWFHPYEKSSKARKCFLDKQIEPPFEKLTPESICLPVLTNHTFRDNLLLCKLN